MELNENLKKWKEEYSYIGMSDEDFLAIYEKIKNTDNINKTMQIYMLEYMKTHMDIETIKRYIEKLNLNSSKSTKFTIEKINFHSKIKLELF